MEPLATAVWTWVLQLTWVDLAWFLIRVTLVALLAHLALALAARASSATRHHIASTALLVLVLLPAATVILPTWPLPILPPERRLAVLAQAATSPVSSVEPVNGAAEAPAAIESVTPKSRSAAPGATPRLILDESLAPLPVISPMPRSAHPLDGARPRSTPPIPAPAAVLLAVLLVTAGLLLRSAICFGLAARLARRATVVADPALRREFERAREMLAVRRPVELKMSAGVAVPAIIGFARPSLVLPVSASTWDLEQLHAVFLHELAHVRRQDALAVMLASVATAIYWLHPLVRSLAREARREAERACDDEVLECGVRPSAYAGHLLQIARVATARDPLDGVMLAVAQRSSLEKRLLSILEPGFKRERLTARTLAAVVAVAVACLVPIAAVQVIAGPSAKHETQAAPPANQETPAAPSAKHKTQPSPVAERFDDSEGAARSGEEWYSEARSHYNGESYNAAGNAYENAAEAGYRRPMALYNAACSYALDGQRLRAIGAIEAAISAGFRDVGLLSRDSDLESIRSDPRFVLMMRGLEYMESDVEYAERTPAPVAPAPMSPTPVPPTPMSPAPVPPAPVAPAPVAAKAVEAELVHEPSASGLYNLACARALSGDVPGALSALEKSVHAGFGSADHMVEDDDLASLRGEPEFRRLVQLTRDLQYYEPGTKDEDPSSWRKSVTRLERVAREHPDLGRAWFSLGFARLRAGDAQGSGQAFARALELGHRPPTTMYNLGCAAAQAGDRDAAIDWLERAEVAGFDLEIALKDGDLDPLRSDPRFKALLDRVRQQNEKEKLSAKKH